MALTCVRRRKDPFLSRARSLFFRFPDGSSRGDDGEEDVDDDNNDEDDDEDDEEEKTARK